MTQLLVVGAGIGGLTAALTLNARGIEAIVIEKATELRPLGVGINLLPHAVRELVELGLGDEIAHIAVAPHAHAFYDTEGNLLFREPRGLEGGYGWPQYSVHRGQLQMMLLTALRDRTGSDVVRTACELTDFEQTNGGVHVRTSSGECEARMLVGADGIHSTVRERLHPAGDPLRWAGVQIFRGVAPGEPFLDGRTAVMVKADGADFVVYPLGGGLINWVMLKKVTAPGALPGDAKWNRPGDRSEVVAMLAEWNLGWLDAVDLVRRTELVLEYPMVDRDVLPWWGRGGVTLLGDAAHPMYPVGANGGSQAIVDARVLADELARDFRGGLLAYERIRRPETADVVAANREMHVIGATQRPEDLAHVTGKYRKDTRADEVRA
ncbi:FAD-dependent monooxygenase [Mycobacterium sp. 3519A]|uniref:FAD-dependent monooxygenase n=1 Tax=Mycobacterium sp. 3519A TaxID=2057184 RepID=UPI000C7C3F33|nr:FAD-dependent monooxygenase [Mycobacterium sp. 3519A]